MKRTWILLAAAWPLAAQLPAQEATPADTGVSSSSLQPGDRIRLSFWREEDLSGEFDVDVSGVVVLPILGARRVTDVPASVLQQELREEYDAQLRNQEVEITLLRRVRVLGQVRAPGLYHVDATMTLADVIALAGGVGSDGKADDIQILRDGQIIRSDLDATARVETTVRSGDQIMIPQRSWLSRNAGVVIGASITALAIIVSAAL